MLSVNECGIISLTGLDGDYGLLLWILHKHETINTRRKIQHAPGLHVRHLCRFPSQPYCHGASVSAFLVTVLSENACQLYVTVASLDFTHVCKY